MVDILLGISVLFLPWWSFVIITIIGSLIFQNYYESFVAGIFMDALSRTTFLAFHGFSLFFTLFVFVMIIIADVSKKKIRFLSS